MEHIVVHCGMAYGPFPSRSDALKWALGSSMADEAYSIFPFNKPGNVLTPNDLAILVVK